MGIPILTVERLSKILNAGIELERYPCSRCQVWKECDRAYEKELKDKECPITDKEYYERFIYRR